MKQIEKYTFKKRLIAIWKALTDKQPVIMSYKQLQILNNKLTNQEGRIENLNQQLMKYMDKEMTRYYRHY